MEDIIHNSANPPAFDDISNYINPPVRALWLDLNTFIQDRFQSAPKITYSVCAGKPGWNVKYQKTGKSICTLYPEKECFIALVVIKEEMAALLQTAQPALHPAILKMIKTVKPFNHTLWLMISVEEKPVLDSLKDLMVYKRSFAG